ncbi:hypothetical protein P5673_013391 [Acropora cervicornis]|uniref:Secreted protein n=1 Tax=Acropora cervicornis TaxID=6130 RepID=A0AAD9V6G5_ACRCE|nr:hypothetical protein P5673_013391 [Acropora cervicornis]
MPILSVRSVELLILLSYFRIQHYATTLDSNCLTSNHVYTVFTVLSVMPLNILNKPLEKNTRVPASMELQTYHHQRCSLWPK